MNTSLQTLIIKSCISLFLATWGFLLQLGWKTMKVISTVSNTFKAAYRKYISVNKTIGHEVWFAPKTILPTVNNAFISCLRSWESSDGAASVFVRSQELNKYYAIERIIVFYWNYDRLG